MYHNLSTSKDIKEKIVRQNVEDDILAEQHFLRTHTEERRESEAGLIVVRANSNHLVGKREISRQLGPGKLFSKGPPNQIKKRSPQPLNYCSCTVFLCNVFGPHPSFSVMSLVNYQLSQIFHSPKRVMSLSCPSYSIVSLIS